MNFESHCSFSFDIADWRASSGYFADLDSWRQWAVDDSFAASLPDYKPELVFLPAMQRRRLSRQARLVCDAAWHLADDYPGSPLVFASYDGEQNRSFELWLELMKTRTVSPTSFGLSVHNAQAGQWSMLRKDMQEHTALGVGRDGLETMMAEVYALLREGAGQVLAVLADDPLEAQYTVDAQRAPMSYALAMIVKPGHRYRLSLLAESMAEAAPQPYWGALDWIRFMLSDRHEENRNYGTHSWLWQKDL